MKAQYFILTLIVLILSSCQTTQPIKNERYDILSDEKTNIQVSKPHSWQLMSRELYLEKLLSQSANLSAMDLETQTRAVKRAVDASVFIIVDNTDKQWEDMASVGIRTIKSAIASQEIFLRTIASSYKRNFPDLEVTEYKTFTSSQLTYPCISFRYGHKDPVNFKACLFPFKKETILATSQFNDSYSYLQPQLEKIMLSIKEKN